MQKICLVLNKPSNASYVKNCEMLHDIALGAYFAYKYMLVSMATKEYEVDLAVREFGENEFHSIIYDKDISKSKDHAIKHAIINNCDIIIFIENIDILTKDSIMVFIKEMSLCNYETSLYSKLNFFAAYKVNSNGYGLTGVRNGKMNYSALLPTSEGFRHTNISEDDLPFKFLT